jgi:uncharacterized protein (TIGR03382 family)
MRRQDAQLFQTISICLPFLFAAPALAGPDWTEIGDAGSTFGSAQVPLAPPGVVQLSSISGQLGTSLRGVIDQEDMYFINVVSPSTFSITTGSAEFNPVLYLFNITVNNDALGLLANDNESGDVSTPLLVGAATDGTGVVLASPGDYLVAITGFGRYPVSASGPIFRFDSPTEISGPDGPGGFNPLSGWAGEGETGSYHIEMMDVGFPHVPAPGTLALPALALGWTARRRRR